MRIVALINQKGGVGKTTTAVNLGAALAREGERVLLVDLDPQGNLTDHLGLEVDEDTITAYDVLMGEASLAEAARASGTDGLSVVPSDEDLAAAEVELVDVAGREMLLRRAMDALDEDAYDWVLVDCPPSLGLLSLNAMAACPEVFITLQTEYFALKGLGQLLRIVDMVRQDIHPALRVSGVIPTLVNPVTNLAKEVIEEVREHFGDVVFETSIRQNVRLAEAPGHGQHIFLYAPSSPGAWDYRRLAREVLARARPTPQTPRADEKGSDEEAPDVDEDGAGAGAPEPEGPATPVPEPRPRPAPPPDPAPADGPADKPTPQPTPQPKPQPKPEPVPEPRPTPPPRPDPAPRPAPPPEPTPSPDPDPARPPRPDPAPRPAPKPGPAPTPSPRPAPEGPPKPSPEPGPAPSPGPDKPAGPSEAGRQA